MLFNFDFKAFKSGKFLAKSYFNIKNEYEQIKILFRFIFFFFAR